jgi:hypothetical protein
VDAAPEEAVKNIMSEINYSTLLRQMVTDYLEQRMSRVEYLAQRRGLLDRIDREFNGDEQASGWSTSDTVNQPTDGGPSPDITLVPKP